VARGEPRGHLVEGAAEHDSALSAEEPHQRRRDVVEKRRRRGEHPEPAATGAGLGDEGGRRPGWVPPAPGQRRVVRRDGRGQGGDPPAGLLGVQVQEFGAGPIMIPMTPAMRRFLFALLRKAGEERSGGTGRGVVVVQIPARPFLRPAFKQFEKRAQKRFLGRVAGLMGMAAGPTPGSGGGTS